MISNILQPIISFMRPFGCPVTILNTLDHLGKFDGKADEGFLVGYSINSKAFRVFNSRTRKVKAGKEKVPDQEYILLPLLHTSSNVPASPEEAEPSPKDDAGKKNGVKDPAKEGDINGPGEETLTNSTNIPNTVSSPFSTVSSSFTTKDAKRTREQRTEYESLFKQDKDINNAYRVFTLVNAATPSNADNPIDPLIPDLEDTANLQDTGIFGNAYNDEDVGVEADINNLETTISVSPIPITIIHKDHPKAQIIREVDSAVQTRRILICTDIAKITRKWSKPGKHRHGKGKSTQEPRVSSKEAMQEELLQFKLLNVWTLVDLPHGKKAIGTKWVFRNKKDQRGIVVRNKARLVAQGYRQEEGLQLEQRKDGIFLSQDKYVFDILKKFGLSSVKTTSTPMETHKPLSKDADGTDVDVHLYRSMIGSLMYLTSSRPDIMFAVCACSRFQVQPKASHMHAVKRIFRYLKGHPKDCFVISNRGRLLGSEI
ncbi:ribonuclease H-like domain, reverse transcriptase, RNA-dependent DNA polymerase [Tanacetum coccineum]